MSNNLKIVLIAFYISFIGFVAAHNAKWVREGISPWWTAYIISFFTSSVYAYLTRHPYFPLTYTSVFQTFFFHGAWYATAFFMLGEHLSRMQGLGFALVFIGFVMMSLK
jgi:drug/metabolite transporter (DMT)-like permease